MYLFTSHSCPMKLAVPVCLLPVVRYICVKTLGEAPGLLTVGNLQKWTNLWSSAQHFKPSGVTVIWSCSSWDLTDDFSQEMTATPGCWSVGDTVGQR